MLLDPQADPVWAEQQIASAGMQDATRIALPGMTLLPGLIDMHVHIFSDDDKVRGRMEAPTRDYEDNMVIGIDNARRTLEAGFTTIRDLGSDIHAVTALRDGINSGLLTGPTIVPAGRMISINGGHGDGSNNLNRELAHIAHENSENLCSGADDCRRAVRSQISQGAEVIKFGATGGVLSNTAAGLGQQFSDEELAALTLGARPSAIFVFITLPNVRWALLYGVLLANARARIDFDQRSVTVQGGAARVLGGLVVLAGVILTRVALDRAARLPV